MKERPTSASLERAARQVFLCDTSAETRRSWTREFGGINFVTAEELARAEVANEAWSSPRCMTAAEARRFTKGRPEASRLARAMAMNTDLRD